MPLLLVAYDLRNPDQNNIDILKHIGKYSNIRLTESSYAIITDKTPKKICEELKKSLNKNDNLYVITLVRPYDAVGSNLVNDWLNKSVTT